MLMQIGESDIYSLCCQLVPQDTRNSWVTTDNTCLWTSSVMHLDNSSHGEQERVARHYQVASLTIGNWFSDWFLSQKRYSTHVALSNPILSVVWWLFNSFIIHMNYELLLLLPCLPHPSVCPSLLRNAPTNTY